MKTRIFALAFAACLTAATGIASAETTTPAAPAAQTANAGGDKVWVNLKSKVYHCPGDKYYGKTKKGEYLSESEAVAKGFHAEGGKACAHA